MGKRFKFVEAHQGLYLAYNQCLLKSSYEEITRESFTGACVGTVAAMLEAVFFRNALSRSFFKAPIIPMFRPADIRCIMLQREYERNSENFFSLFIRDKLKISDCDHSEEPRFCLDIRDTLKNIEYDKSNNLLLLTISFNLKTPETTYVQEHMMCILKHEGYYLFFDPNIGLAIFNSLDSMKNWLDQEIKEGALSYFDREELIKLKIYDNKDNPLKEGLLSIQSINIQSYPFDLDNNPRMTFHSCL